MFLEYTLISMDKTEKFLNGIIKAWKNGDVKFLEKALFADVLNEDKRLIEIYNKTLFERNDAMVEKIKGFLKTNKIYFVIVGAGHLIGEKGIVQLLQKDGYAVKQL